MRSPETITAALESALPGANVVALSPLRGGMSAELWAADLSDGRRVVVRYPHPYLKTLHADPVAHEFATLQALRAAGLPVPSPWAMAGEGDDRCVLMERLPGSPLVAPRDPRAFVETMAETLARIHATPLTDFGFLPETRPIYTPPDRALNLDLREPEVIAAVQARSPADLGPTVLRHGDFWPGNVLWEGDRLTGILDWENALRGPPLADLGIARLDLRWMLGRDAVAHFTASYLARCPMDTATLRYWDLRAALRPMVEFDDWAAPYAALGRTDITPATMREGLLDFIHHALRG